LVGLFPHLTPEPEDAADAALADHLLQRAKALRKDWSTWRIDERPAKSPAPRFPGEPAAPKPTLPKADIPIGVLPDSLFRPVGTVDAGFVLTIPPRALGPATDKTAKGRGDLPLADIGGRAAELLADQPPVETLLYDFRAAPDDIMGSLRWIEAPAAKKSGP
jgi:hypothetical protein